jgi:chemotaxis signal transduction protein
MISKTNGEDMRKGNENLVKLIDQAVKIQERIKAMRQDNEPVKILVEKLNNVMTIKWNDAKSPEAKQAIKEILDVVVKEMEGVT